MLEWGFPRKRLWRWLSSGIRRLGFWRRSYHPYSETLPPICPSTHCHNAEDNNLQNDKLVTWHFPNYAVITFQNIRCQPNFAQVGIVLPLVKYVFIQRPSSLNPNSNTLKPDWTLHSHPATCVIAQQYSSATFVPWHFHSLNEKYGALFKKVTSIVLLFRRFRNLAKSHY